MDPQATLKRYVDTFGANDGEEMAQAVDDYNGWISSGGFPATLTDGRAVYKLYVISSNWRTAADVGYDSVKNSPLGTGLTPLELIYALRDESPKSDPGLQGRLLAALRAHSGCCLDTDEEVDKVLAAIFEAAQPRTGQ